MGDQIGLQVWRCRYSDIKVEESAEVVELGEFRGESGEGKCGISAEYGQHGMGWVW